MRIPQKTKIYCRGGDCAVSGLSEEVYQIVARIPPGKVISYGQIARLIGRPRAARIVGYAMSKAPAGLPSHRVLRKDGSLPPGDVFGIPGLQRAELEAEGVTFLPDGRVDMTRHGWV